MFPVSFRNSIGFAIARRLGLEGAQVVVSSRKADHVTKAEKQLRSIGIDVTGLVCHVSQQADRDRLFEHVCYKFCSNFYQFIPFRRLPLFCNFRRSINLENLTFWYRMQRPIQSWDRLLTCVYDTNCILFKCHNFLCLIAF